MVQAGDIIRASDVAVQACRVTRTAALSIPDATATTVPFTAEVFDTASMHDNSTDNSRITAPLAGVYAIGFNGSLQAGSDYVRSYAILMLNGSTEIARSAQVGTTSVQQYDVSTVYQLGAGDYIEVQIFQDNTANAARTLDVSSERSPVFHAARIGS